MNPSVKKLVFSGMCVAVGIVLPFITGHVPAIGNMLCPMHIPVLICGFICGPWYGMLTGFVLPFLRYMLVGFPVLLPNGLSMAFELAAYGLISGMLYRSLRHRGIFTVYAVLLTAMVCGRIVWGLVRTALSYAVGAPFGWQAFLSGALLTAIPGILIQLILIPVLVLALERSGFTR